MFLGQFVIEKYPKGTILFHDSSPTWLAKLGLPWPLSANDAAPASLGEIFRYQPAHVLVQHIFKRKHKMQILIVEKTYDYITLSYNSPFFLRQETKAQLTKKNLRGPSRVMNLLMNLPRSAGPIFSYSTRRKKKRVPFKWSNHCQANRFAGKLFPKPCEVGWFCW